VLGDMHEYQASGASEVLHNDPSRVHGNTDAQIKTLTGDATSAYVVPALRAAGFRTGPYLAPMAPTGPNENILVAMSGLRHVVATLIETPRLGTLSPTKRVAAQGIAIDALVKMLGERRALLASTTAGSAARATAEGAAGDPRYVFTSSTIGRAPCGYRLTGTQYTKLQRTLDLHGIRATASGSSWSVSLAQAAEPVIPLLMDSRAAYEVTSAQPLAC
jgi:hypothetical protein